MPVVPEQDGGGALEKRETGRTAKQRLAHSMVGIAGRRTNTACVARRDPFGCRTNRVVWPPLPWVQGSCICATSLHEELGYLKLIHSI